MAEPLEKDFARVLSLLEYAGIVRSMESVSRGTKGVFHRYALHHSIILAENSLSLGRSFPLVDANKSLAEQKRNVFVKSKLSSLVDSEALSSLRLDLAPCQRCGAPRATEEARFCMKCGARLEEASVYEELLRRPVDELPLTPNKIEGLKKHTSIRTVQDVLLDEEQNEVRRVPYVGEVWAARIRNAAEEFVSV